MRMILIQIFHIRASRRSLDATVLLMALLGHWGTAVGAAAAPDLTQLSIEELMNVPVVSATKQTQRLSDTASAVFVITADDIRRSGVTSVPEALRLAPGVQVARIGASQWAVTIRGFNGRYANKLLVLVDGRSIYTPAFAGVYWEIQDLLLEDIDRIEVIRGPGASLWGANAVNGVINILTKAAADTEGLISVTAGSPENTIVGVRHSGSLGEDARYRIYGKYLKQDGLLDLQGQDAEDDWRLGGGGFRLDWTPSERDRISLHGGAVRRRDAAEPDRAQLRAALLAAGAGRGRDDRRPSARPLGAGSVGDLPAVPATVLPEPAAR